MLQVEKDQRSFLIIQTAFIGDVILATALVEKIRQYFPTSPVDFLLRKGNELLLKNHPQIREVLIFDKSKKYKNLVSLIREIRTKRYHYVINVQRFATTGIVTFLSGAKIKIGFDKNPFSFLYTIKVNHLIGDIHEVERNQKLIQHLTDQVSARPRLYPSVNDIEKVNVHIQAGSYYCIAPTSVWFTKQWPANKWIELIDYLHQKVNAIYLLGVLSDNAICEYIRLHTVGNNVVNLCGELTLLQSAALMKSAKMNFVNDSSPMHLASAMNAPVTVIYCSTIPAFGFGPLSDESYVLESKEKLSCRPCGLHGFRKCPEQHFKCAETIDLNQFNFLL